MVSPPTTQSHHRIALVGAGLMGSGLARLFRNVGWEVAVWDLEAAALDRLCRNTPSVRRAVNLVDAVSGATLVIEAAAEKAPIKQQIFAELAASTSQATLLATNSSVIPVGLITRDLSDATAARTLGTHFWNPPDLIPLVEVIAGPRTSPPAIAQAMELLNAAGREPVHVRRDVVPGNRLQHALWREAMALVDEGVCSAEDVDRIVKRSFGARLPVLGPLENADLVGLELTEQIHSVVLPMLSCAKHPAEGLQRRLNQGRTGIAAGVGYYGGWNAQSIASVRERLATHLRQWFSSGNSS